MPASLSEVGNSSSLPPQSVAAEIAASSSLGHGAMGEGGVSKTALAIWKKLSESLAENPSAHWNEALNTADELARSVCGQNLAMDLQADLLGNDKVQLLAAYVYSLSQSPDQLERREKQSQ